MLINPSQQTFTLCRYTKNSVTFPAYDPILGTCEGELVRGKFKLNKLFKGHRAPGIVAPLHRSIQGDRGLSPAL